MQLYAVSAFRQQQQHTKRETKQASASIQKTYAQIIPGIVRMTQSLAGTQDIICTLPLKSNEPQYTSLLPGLGGRKKAQTYGSLGGDGRDGHLPVQAIAIKKRIHGRMALCLYCHCWGPV